MVKQIPLHKARAQLSSLIDEVASGALIYEITHYGRPVARLGRATPPRKMAFHLAERRLQRLLAEIADCL